jgi:hypothetical protein
MATRTGGADPLTFPAYEDATSQSEHEGLRDCDGLWAALFRLNSTLTAPDPAKLQRDW